MPLKLGRVPGANDRHRRYADGRSSYDKVITAIGPLREPVLACFRSRGGWNLVPVPASRPAAPALIIEWTPQL
jgi:hypothetical protein